jgi:hypothetical protein
MLVTNAFNIEIHHQLILIGQDLVDVTQLHLCQKYWRQFCGRPHNNFLLISHYAKKHHILHETNMMASICMRRQRGTRIMPTLVRAR